MRGRLVICISFAFACFQQECMSQPAGRALHNYVAKKDLAYRWEPAHTATAPNNGFYEVSLTSQKWQGITWKHRLVIYFPKNGKHPNTVLLVLRHLYNRYADLAGLKYISDSTGTASAYLYDMPNQPLFGGKEEDDLQAYTYARYLKTGDETWPLQFPMVKTVVRAIDAIEALALNKEKRSTTKFIIAGHSKRGHAAWLAAAIDPRIKGVIPMAIDVLNAKAQMPHHLKSFGAYHTPSKDATDLLKELHKPLGDRLIELIDPYFYKDQLSLPKLIVSATNDDYFPTDALNLYWEGLKGSNSLLYLSNAGHVRADSDPRINPSAFAFVRAVATGKILPPFSWQFHPSEDSIRLTINGGASARRAVLWQARSSTNDFRGSQWEATSIKESGKAGMGQFVIAIAKPALGNSILYGEIEFEQDGHRFLLSTQTYRFNSKKLPE